MLTLFQKFKVKSWPKEEYGKFYDGDSYIILNVSEAL
jgi:gelsolin